MFRNRARAGRKFASIAAVALIATLATGAIAADLTKITFQLNYPAAGYNAGYELAVEKGFYRDVGLDVTIEPGNGSQITAQLVAAGKADIAFADASPVMKLISQGAKMKVLATILQGNPNQVTALKKTGLKSVADIKGRSVAMPNGGSQVAMFPLVLAANGLKDTDIKIVNMPPDSMVPSLLQGTVDVILGSVDAYGPQLKSMNVETDNFLFIDSGAPTVSTSIIASDAFLEAHPDQARAFVAASLKAGTRRSTTSLPPSPP
jgi:NitT/TauT family transport system substrate-binding protein